MTRRRLLSPVFLTLVVVTAAVPGAATAQEAPLSRAKAYYASAAYEDALQLLTNLGGSVGPAEATEVAAYQVFCLVALGRMDEARAASEAIVHTDPLYRPSASAVSPRVRAFFEEVRRPLLPEVVKASYARAKSAFDRKEMAAARFEFDRVIAIADELAAAGDTSAADLKTLSNGFRDLATAALAPPPPPPPPPVVEAPKVEPKPEPAPERIYGAADVEVAKPTVVTREMPTWRPETPAENLLGNKGTVELVIDERGRVIHAQIVDSINLRYDPMLLRAVAHWTFVPATKDGKPVKYRYRIGVSLNR